MAKPLSYANALKELSGQDRALGELVEKVTNEGLDAVGFPGLFGLREFAVGQGRKALEGLGTKLRGTDRRLRTQRIEAAHKVLLVVSFFDPLDDCLSAAGIRLRAADLEMTADEQQALLERALRAEEVYAPAGDFVWDREKLFGWAEMAFRASSEMLLQLIPGLAAAELAGVDSGRGSRLVGALRGDLPQRALTAYRNNYLKLCTEAPEFRMWAQLREHEQTQGQIRQLGDAFDKLHSELSRISSGRSVSDLRIRLSRKYQALLDKQVLPMDDVLAEDLPPGMVIPPLRDCYVPPSARVARIRKGDTPSAKGWWEGCALLPDLQRFLTVRLTHPDMTRHPTVLLGEPGAGKSKLTEVLAAQLPEEDFLAVRVELRTVSADAAVHTQIEEGLEHELRQRVSWTGLLDEAEGALPVVVLDGFDELLQAAGVERYNYLEQIRDFQEDQEDMGQPVAVIVTSRTLSASRVRFPEHSTVIRLEPFGHDQIDRVLRTWNHTNRARFDSGGVRPLDLDRLLAYPELSEQPLLLLLLLVYDAQDNELQRASDSMSLGQLYERLLSTFVHRQVRKHRRELGEKDLRKEVRGELHRLEATALAMFTRQRQSVGSAELGRDLTALELGGPQRRAEATTGLPIEAADLLLGRFFFVHVAQARISAPDRTPLSAYEFLHATFGEYLVARLVHRALTSLVDERIRSEEKDSWEKPANDGLLYATSSFASYADRQRIVDFLKEMIGKDIAGNEERRTHYSELLIDLFQGAPYPSADRLHSSYQPRRLPLTARQAFFTANLMVLLLIARGEPVDIRELFDDSRSEQSVLHQWRSAAALWRALPSADWFPILDTLRMRHRGEGKSTLELERGLPVNVVESIRFEIPESVLTSERGPIPTRGSHDLHIPFAAPASQQFRSMALRVNGTAARLAVELLPVIRTGRLSTGIWQGHGSIDELWSLAHELQLLRLTPAVEEPERRLDAYQRVLLYRTLGSSELLVLRQALEDFRNSATGKDYRRTLQLLLREYFASLDTQVEAMRPPDGETVAVLEQLSPYLSGVIDQILSKLEQSADLHGTDPASDRTFVSDRYSGAENSVVDIKPHLDVAFHENPWSPEEDAGPSWPGPA